MKIAYVPTEIQMQYVSDAKQGASHYVTTLGSALKTKQITSLLMWEPSTLNQALADQRGPPQIQRPLGRAPLATTYVQHASRQSQSRNHPLLSNDPVNKPATNTQPTIEDVHC
jgi:hypothetical protein